MDVITAITKERGRLRIVVNEDSEVLVPVSLFRERPLSVGDAIDMEEYEKINATLKLFSELEKGEQSARENGWVKSDDVKRMLRRDKRN